MKNKSLNVFQKHQLKIARDTLKMTDEAVFVLGGMTKKEAKEFIEKISKVK